MTERTIRVLDTTLRDGEQTPGVSLTPDEKLEIAQALDKLGVDVIEAGFPISSKGEQEGVRRIARAGLRAEVSGLARAEKVDIDTAINCGVKGVHVFLGSSDIHLQYKLHLTREQMVKQSADMVRYAKSFGVKVEFSAEDATRTEIPFFKEVVKAVTEAGIDRFDIPDTVGIATPKKMMEYVEAARSVSDAMISVHCHNDYGLAVANSLAGVVAGADQAHLTINGIGERSGNTSLEEFVMGCYNLYALRTNVNYSLLYETSRLVSRLTGVIIQPNKAIIGDNAFGHESGIHTHGILSNPSTYEPFDPAMVGRTRWLQAGKHAGRHGIAFQLRGMGLKPKEDSLRLIVEKVKEMGDEGRTITDSDLYQLAVQIMGGGKAESADIVELEGLEVVTGIKRLPSATVKLLVRGQLHEATDVGSGPVDAAVNAIQKIFSTIDIVKLKEYRLEALTGDAQAVADVSVKVEDSTGLTASGRGMKRDIVVASVEAIVSGINALMAKKLQSQPTASLSPQGAQKPIEGI
ncbi:MAG TPA: 2-isopropylmalate synthase [Nitrososphaerales archaeon]|nr:2-isopropylmalate synthase [Nitrososphaerales archaeon]